MDWSEIRIRWSERNKTDFISERNVWSKQQLPDRPAHKYTVNADAQLSWELTTELPSSVCLLRFRRLDFSSLLCICPAVSLSFHVWLPAHRMAVVVVPALLPAVSYFPQLFPVWLPAMAIVVPAVLLVVSAVSPLVTPTWSEGCVFGSRRGHHWSEIRIRWSERNKTDFISERNVWSKQQLPDRPAHKYTVNADAQLSWELTTGSNLNHLSSLK